MKTIWITKEKIAMFILGLCVGIAIAVQFLDVC